MKVLIVNGPNLNNLGRRDTEQYGGMTLLQIENRLREKAKSVGVVLEFYQSNHEGSIVDFLQESTADIDGIVINAGALTHYGLSLRDALADTSLPMIEVHISNIHAREEFRNHSVLAEIAIGQIVGLGWRGYIYALDFLATHLKGVAE